LKQVNPTWKHITTKGGRGSVVGYGELKKLGYDPLFSLNHCCAMIRDNLKRLSRRTWCTTKKIENLQNQLNVFQYFYNTRLNNRALA
jgi:hypothetical protein